LRTNNEAFVPKRALQLFQTPSLSLSFSPTCTSLISLFVDLFTNGGSCCGEGLLLSTLGRLFTNYFQSIHGFTCGIDDMILTKNIEVQRTAVIKG
jgi:hypothetical protein